MYFTGVVLLLSFYLDLELGIFVFVCKKRCNFDIEGMWGKMLA